MPADEFAEILAQFRQSLADGCDLYRSSGKLADREQSHRSSTPPPSSSNS